MKNGTYEQTLKTLNVNRNFEFDKRNINPCITIINKCKILQNRYINK